MNHDTLLQSIDNFVALAESKVYGPYGNGNQDRRIVIIIDDAGNRRTVSYPKYLVEQNLGRPLHPDLETIDHINRDKTDNDINNLRIMPRDEHSRSDTRRVKLVKFKCSLCEKDFERSPRLVRDKSKKGKSGVFCSRQCAGRYARQLQLGLIEKFPVQPYIESEYYRNTKDVVATMDYLIAKYGSTTQ
jgi:hypothetical protein